MQNCKMDNAKIEDFIKFITTDLHVDIPLFYNNIGKSIKFDFEDVDVERASNVIEEVIHLLFAKRPLWVCEYGSITGSGMLDNGLFSTCPKIEIIPYISSVDKDYFEYDHDAIACVRTNIDTFCVRKYIAYVLEYEFISNTIFLIDEVKGIALYAYDRRGMDIAARDNAVLRQLLKKFGAYISKTG